MPITIEDLKPIIDLMTVQEERLCGKINDLHVDVKDTNAEVKKINSRVHIVETDNSIIKNNCDNRLNSCNIKFEDLTPTTKVIKFLNILLKRPKLIIVTVLLIIAGVQFLIQELIERNLISEIIKLFK